MSSDLVDQTPYDDLDEPVVGLCRVLNSFPGLRTIGSCGGHEGGGRDEEGRTLPAGDMPANEWRVTIGPEVTRGRPTAQGWLSLEFVAWVLYDIARVKAVELQAFALPPFVNEPAHMLEFEIHGWRDGEGGISPDEVAEVLARLDREIYRPGTR
jgi:hypothetical protein